uniref:Uncharacterized protein n=1 Tax=Glossina pallidipes TaxID=7398 RepID=A0A1B0AH10_GLOPL
MQVNDKNSNKNNNNNTNACNVNDIEQQRQRKKMFSWQKDHQDYQVYWKEKKTTKNMMMIMTKEAWYELCMKFDVALVVVLVFAVVVVVVVVGARMLVSCSLFAAYVTTVEPLSMRMLNTSCMGSILACYKKSLINLNIISTTTIVILRKYDTTLLVKYYIIHDK